MFPFCQNLLLTLFLLGWNWWCEFAAKYCIWLIFGWVFLYCINCFLLIVCLNWRVQSVRWDRSFDSEFAYGYNYTAVFLLLLRLVMTSWIALCYVEIILSRLDCYRSWMYVNMNNISIVFSIKDLLSTFESKLDLFMHCLLVPFSERLSNGSQNFSSFMKFVNSCGFQIKK